MEQLKKDNIMLALKHAIVEKSGDISILLKNSIVDILDDKEPKLGCATTRELIEELHARMTVSGCNVAGLNLDYRTVDADLWKRVGEENSTTLKTG